MAPKPDPDPNYRGGEQAEQERRDGPVEHCVEAWCPKGRCRVGRVKEYVDATCDADRRLLHTGQKRRD